MTVIDGPTTSSGRRAPRPTRAHRLKQIVGYSAVALVVIAGTVSVPIELRYQRDLQSARELQRADGSLVVETTVGPVEYATYGEDPPVLLAHELLGGFNHGLLIARSQFGDRVRTIAVSRFGYLGTPLPTDASAAAQADAYAALLDRLGIQRVVIVGTSAGEASAIEFALRHPDRTSGLVLLSGTGPGDAPPPPRVLTGVVFGSDFAWWPWQTYAESSLLSIMGVSLKDLDLTTSADDPLLAELMPRFLPITTRTAGALNDMYVTNMQFNDFPFERIAVPTLVVNAVDDTLAPYAFAKARAERIPGTRFVTLDHGGHLLLRQQQRVKAELSAFVSTTK